VLTTDTTPTLSCARFIVPHQVHDIKLLESPAKHAETNRGLVHCNEVANRNYTVEGWVVRVWPSDLSVLVRFQVKPVLPM
jgi:hypothetical protein